MGSNGAAPDPAGAAVPRKVWIGGDSMACRIGPTLQAELRKAGAAGVPWLCRSSSGLVRSDFLHWPNTARRQMARYRPKAAVFMIGTNDGQGMTVKGRVYP